MYYEPFNQSDRLILSISFSLGRENWKIWALSFAVRVNLSQSYIVYIGVEPIMRLVLGVQLLLG